MELSAVLVFLVIRLGARVTDHVPLLFFLTLPSVQPSTPQPTLRQFERYVEKQFETRVIPSFRSNKH